MLSIASECSCLCASGVLQRVTQRRLLQVRHLTGLDKYGEYIQVRKRKEHFIFTIESVGSIPPAQLFIKALDILRAKCDALSEVL